MRDLPFASFRKELVFRHLDAMTGCQCLDDRVEFLAVRCAEVDTNAKTIYQRKFFLYVSEEWNYSHYLQLPV